ncbi:MAG TPA: hypothetical protein VGF92_19885 [Stellaceae bacterium]
MAVKESDITLDVASPKYLMALGKFIAEFAWVECYMNIVVWEFAELPSRAVGTALLPGMKIDAAMGHLKRLIRARKLRGRHITELSEIIRHLTDINAMRNAVVHYGALRQRGRGFVATNKHLAMKEKAVTAKVGPKALDSMSRDLANIWLRLRVIIGDWEPDDTEEQKREILRHLRGRPLPASWRYKHAPINPPRRRPHRKRPKQKAPHRASGA